LIANVLFPSVPMWQVVSDKGIPVKNLNEIKSVLVSALASHGQMSDALDIYEEIKQVGSNLEPKAVISLIVSSSINDCILSLVHAMTGS
jgi:pentatricopeptide repeat protein